MTISHPGFQAFDIASKFALEGYAEALAYEVAPFGIHVTLIQPGNFATVRLGVGGVDDELFPHQLYCHFRSSYAAISANLCMAGTVAGARSPLPISRPECTLH